MIEVYYVEDDEFIGNVVKEYLEEQSFHVLIYTTVEAARQALTKHVPSLILLDWNMPGGQGDVLCRWIRPRRENLPVMFLTVHGGSHNTISGFQNGAGDYVVRPFDLDVLYPRMCALLHRTGNVSAQCLSCDNISIGRNGMRVFCRGEEITLSQQEYQVLLLSMQNRGRTVPRDKLLEQVWDINGGYVNDSTLTVIIRRLREKLNQPSCLKTVKSSRYRMKDTI